MQVELDGRLKGSPFIREMMKSNYVVCPNELLLGYPDLSNLDVCLYLHLVRFGLMSILNNHVESTGEPIVYPSQETLSKLLRVSQPTVSRGLEKLKQVRLISIHRRGLGISNLITVHAVKQREKTIKVQQSVEESIPSQADTSFEKMGNRRKQKAQTAPTESHSVEEILSGNTGKVPKEKKKKLSTSEIREALNRAEGGPQEETPKDRRNSLTLLSFFTSEVKRTLTVDPLVVRGKDLRLLKLLIDHYGYDRASELVEYAVTYWQQFKGAFHLSGDSPTIGLIWGYKSHLDEKANYISDSSSEPKEEGDSQWY